MLAIVALTGGKLLGWVWLHPAMGLAGAGVTTQWDVILLDRQLEETDLNVEIRKALGGADADTVIADLHIWPVAMNKFAAIISVVAHEPKSPDASKNLWREHEELVHPTVEVNRGGGDEVELTGC